MTQRRSATKGKYSRKFAFNSLVFNLMMSRRLSIIMIYLSYSYIYINLFILIIFILIIYIFPECQLTVTHFAFNKVASFDFIVRFNKRSIYFAVNSRYTLGRILLFQEFWPVLRVRSDCTHLTK